MLSVVMPVFNELDWTKQCIDSLRLHIDEPYEIVIVDDGSTDGTKEWIEEKMKRHQNIRYFRNEKNKGVTQAWNKGVLEAEGDYILVINNDVRIINPNTIPLMKTLADRHILSCPNFYRRHEETLNTHNGSIGMAGFFFMFRKDKSLFPIDERLKIFYNDNWLAKKAKGDVGWGGTIRHYESQTINSKNRGAEYEKSSYWMEKDNKTRELILDENNRR